MLESKIPKIKINHNEIKNYILIFLITFCIQTTDVKIGFIKISEIILLLLTPIFFLKKINKYLFYFLIFFVFSLFTSLIITASLDFQILGKSLIKAPFIITIARFLELITCLTVSLLTLYFFKNNTSLRAINTLVNLNIYITIFFVLLFFLVTLHIIPLESSIIVYENNRLRGLYFEGGPYGLMLGFIFILTTFQSKTPSRIYKRIFLIITITFLAKSKAGMMLILIWFIINNYELINSKFREYKKLAIIIFIITFYFAFTNIGYMYFDQMDKIRIAVRERPQDQYLILGRMSGIYIVPQMVKQNPIFGIGIGNYPLIRNNSEYRTFFPIPPKEMIDIDSHGLGGIVDVIVDTGFFGFFIFASILFLLFKDIIRHRSSGKKLFILYIFIYLFGVQLSFLYPWIFLGIILAYKNNYINEISN